MAIKLEWKERHVKIALTIAIICFGIGLVTAVPPTQPYTLYGTATLNGNVLTAQDDDVIALKVDGVELVSYTMGDLAGIDHYVLEVPMDSNSSVTTAAQEGDSAYIYINGVEINEGVQVIGAPATVVTLDISATSASNPPAVTVVYPNGGESIPIGTQVQVSTRATDDTAVTGVTFYYSTGTNWNSMGAGTRVSGTDKDGTWDITWDTAGLSAGTNYKLKAVASDGTSTSEDQSDSVFSVTASKVIYVPDVYSTIQAAVNSASTGDTIIVRDGVYTESINVNKPHLTIMSENGAENCIVQAANSDDDVFYVTTDYVDICGFTIGGGQNGVSVSLVDVDYCSILNNIVSDNIGDCIVLNDSSSNIISSNIVSNNNGCSLVLEDNSNSNIIANNTVSGNNGECIHLDYSSSNTITNNILAGNSGCSLVLEDNSNSNIIANNILSDNDGCCIVLDLSSNNKIYLNNFMNNRENVRSSDSTNIWESPSKITYSYKGNTYTSYLGNYWGDYTGLDANGDGIGDIPFSINWDKDNHPLMQPLENYSELQEEKIFDTDSPANPYPSIPGTHTGTITPSHDITVQKLYTYPCAGTGGHTESVRIYGNGKDESASKTGYKEDEWAIIFDSSFILEAGKTYNYEIITGSYPQIHHTKTLQTETGWLNCTKFTDANGKVYQDWIPAIQLFG